MLGAQFGNVFVGVQPAFGYEGDPMRLLFESGFAPTHAFSAFYRYLREDFRADAVLHFGTHGALEFMPGKQTGLSGACWPDRLIGDLPNIYLYAANNPSEGTIAKRRSAATLVSYLTPPVAHAGLYRGLLDLKASHRALARPGAARRAAERRDLAELDPGAGRRPSTSSPPSRPGTRTSRGRQRLGAALLELEYTLIPHGLHVVGEAHRRPSGRHAAAIAEAGMASPPTAPASSRSWPARPRSGAAPQACRHEPTASPSRAARHRRLLAQDHEIAGAAARARRPLHPPGAGGDLLRTPDDPADRPQPARLRPLPHAHAPSPWPTARARRERLLARHRATARRCPRAVALVLWGTDNLKSEGGPIAQALALIGARPALRRLRPPRPAPR